MTSNINRSFPASSSSLPSDERRSLRSGGKVVEAATRAKRTTPSPSIDEPKTLRSRTLSTSSATVAAPKRISTTVPRSAVVNPLPESFRLPFSVFPLYYTFMKPLSKIKLTSEFKTLEKSDLIGNYEEAIRERGFDDTVVEVAFISDTIGHGVFAKRAIKAGEKLAVYSGRYQLGHSSTTHSRAYIYDLLEGIDSKDCPMRNIKAQSNLAKAAREAFGEDHVKPDEGYELGIDGLHEGNFTRYFNDGGHNSNLVAEICIINGQLEIVISASKDIKAGNQLLISYGAQYWNGFAIDPEKKHEPLTPTRYKLELPQEPSLTLSSSSSSSSFSYSSSLPLYPEPATDDDALPFLLEHQQRLRELNAKSGDITFECLKEAQGLLRPSAPKGAEKIAFCYLNLAHLRSDLKNHLLSIQELVRIIPVQRYEMEMTLLDLKDQLRFSSSEGLEQIDQFFKLEQKLRLGGLGFKEIESLATEYQTLRLSVSNSLLLVPILFRLIELNLHLAKYGSGKEVQFLRCAQVYSTALFSLDELSQMPYTRRLANVYSIQAIEQLLNPSQELLPVISAQSPTPSIKRNQQRLQQLSLSAFREIKHLPPSKERRLKCAFSLLDPNLPRGLKQNAFKIVDGSALEAGAALVPLRLQHYEIKSELLKLRLKTSKTSEELKLLELEDRLKQGQLRFEEFTQLSADYQQLAQSEALSLKAIALLRLSELHWNYSEVQEDKLIARAHLASLKSLLEEHPDLLPHTGKVIDYYLTN